MRVIVKNDSFVRVISRSPEKTGAEPFKIVWIGGQWICFLWGNPTSPHKTPENALQEMLE